MSKLPEMPDFLNKKPQENIPNSPEETKQEKKTVTAQADEPPPVPVATHPKKEVKKTFVVKAEKPDVQEEQEKKISPTLPKTESSLKQKITYCFTIGLILILTGTSTYFYLQYKKFEDKYIAIDSKLLNLTKQITGLNQENNKLSEKVVNYQKELENIKTIEANSEELQEKLIKNETEKKELLDKIKAMEDYLAKKAEEEFLRERDIRPKKNKINPKQTKVIPKVKPEIKVEPPKPTQKELSSIEKFDHLFDYETSLSSAKQLSCKKYFKEETLKRCNTNHPALDYNLSTSVRDLVLEGKPVKKLVYKCTSPTGKDKLFKYGPLELFNTCK